MAGWVPAVQYKLQNHFIEMCFPLGSMNQSIIRCAVTRSVQVVIFDVRVVAVRLSDIMSL